MSLEAVKDSGQKMPAPTGRAVGFIDTKPECDAVIQSLKEAGFPAAKMTVLHGAAGLQMLDRSAQEFFFGDGEDDLIELAREELNDAHFALFVEVADRDEADRVVSLALLLGGHSFSYFGTWVNERLTK